MNKKFKILLKYILFKKNYLFFKNNVKNNNSLLIFLSNKNFYYLIIHIKLSSVFYSSQLIDIFSYELPVNKNLNLFNKIANQSNNLIIYNFNFILTQSRLIVYLYETNNYSKNKNALISKNITSITEIFNNANWLEREVSELNNIFFLGKKDLRNLLLPYGDTSSPMKKSYPSIGLREYFFDSNIDSLVQKNTSFQF